MSSGADRAREFRRRNRTKRFILTIEVDPRLPDRLVDGGFLKEWSTEDRQEIRRAVERLLHILVEASA